MKIILTGTYHSGKTTLLNRYKDSKDINVMGELVRSLSLEPNFYFKADKIQNYAFSEYSLASILYGMAQVHYLLENDKPWLFDRCIVDILYYFRYFDIDAKLGNNSNLYECIIDYVYKLIKSGYFKDSIFLLLKPIHIVSQDDIRMEGEDDQVGVYNVAKNVLKELELVFHEQHANEAHTFIEQHIKLK